MFLKVVHIFLAINLLASSMGVTVFEHLCQMKGRTITLFSKAESCCKKKEHTATVCKKTSCCEKKKATQGVTIKKKPCCEDKSQLVKADYEGSFQKTVKSADNFDPLSIPPVFVAFSTEKTTFSITLKLLRFYLYKPPPRQGDIRVLIQSFLC